MKIERFILNYINSHENKKQSAKSKNIQTAVHIILAIGTLGIAPLLSHLKHKKITVQTKFKTSLKKWAKKEPSKYKKEALKRIFEAYNSSSETLNLNNLNLTTLPPELGTLTHLKKIELESNKLTTLPKTIGNLTKLEFLSVKNNPDLKELPQSLEQCFALNTLEHEETNFDVNTTSLLKRIGLKKILKNAKKGLSLSKKGDDGYKDDVFILSLIQQNNFGKDATNFIHAIVTAGESPTDKLNTFRKELEKLMKLHLKEGQKYPDGYQFDMMIALLIAEKNDLPNPELTSFYEFFSGESPFSTEQIKTDEQKSRLEFQWSRMQVAMGAVKYFSEKISEENH